MQNQSQTKENKRKANTELLKQTLESIKNLSFEVFETTKDKNITFELSNTLYTILNTTTYAIQGLIEYAVHVDDCFEIDKY